MPSPTAAAAAPPQLVCDAAAQLDRMNRQKHWRESYIAFRTGGMNKDEACVAADQACLDEITRIITRHMPPEGPRVDRAG